MNKPIIGITADLTRRKDGVHIGEVQQYLNNCYLTSILQAGGVPLILPVASDAGVIGAYIKTIDGLLLSGGGDINPLLFGEEPHPKLGVVDAGRDAMEITLAQQAIAAKMPLLAICRGIQILNVAFGGTVYQHLSSSEFSVQHRQNSAGDFAGHTVFIEKGTYLASLCGTEAIVNSFHHQAVKEVAAGFTVAARAKDGVIEAIEAIEGIEDIKGIKAIEGIEGIEGIKAIEAIEAIEGIKGIKGIAHTAGGVFAVGVQWHPERMVGTHPAMRQLFKDFIQKSRQFSGNARQGKIPIPPPAGQ